MRLFVCLIAAVAAAACSAAPDAAPASDPLTDRFWMSADNDGRTGVIRAFLSDGSFLQGSCGEPYRLSAWRRSGDRLIWTEDGVEISADVIESGPGALTIGLNLPDGQKVERYRPAQPPFVCPDMPR